MIVEAFVTPLLMFKF